ncbi:class I SAM-dependent DNA methyltransferase [Planococcus sp. FY231025]|uniref:class I SAM-dependent DNA methyltransferase n=1 Tax=Planococcus sp. FY231025 TaxID=3455699 RepID=UPI003F8EE326
MGREFVEIFDEWVHTYDDSVYGKDQEYEDVFAEYNGILQAVADLAKGPVVEFGVGTGNLTEKLLGRGLEVAGIEPNRAMREATAAKLPGTPLIDGDFLEFDAKLEAKSFVSTYAFHHLTDQEKARAFMLYAEMLPAGGKVVFADTLFETEEAKQQKIEFESARGYANLVEDLNREYYTTLPVMQQLIEAAGFAVEFTQLNEYVWLINATKRSGNGRESRQ